MNDRKPADDRVDPSPEKSPSSCRMCGKNVTSSAETYPFCSKRCQMADLGAWFSGAYSVSRPLSEEDDEL